METCINTLFVLTNSDSKLLSRLMENMDITKKELVAMLKLVLRQNINEYQFIINYYNKSAVQLPRYPSYKPIMSEVPDFSPRSKLNRSRSRS